MTNAIDTYKWLNKWRPFEEETEIYRINQQVHTYPDGDKPIVFRGQISDRCPTCNETLPLWLHDLYRKSFTFDQVVGTIESFQLYCGYHWSQVSYQEGKVWKINPDWGSCDVIVYGTEGTTFRLVERH